MQCIEACKEPEKSSPGAGIAADELQRAESFANAALAGASCKSEAGLKLLGDIRLAFYAAGASPAQDTQHQSAAQALEGFFTAYDPTPQPASLYCPGSPGLSHKAATAPGVIVGCAGWHCRWESRIKSVQQARRAYARALHLKPDRGSTWGDTACAFYTEAQLRRAHSRLRPQGAEVLYAAAERCAKGAVPLTCIVERAVPSLLVCIRRAAILKQQFGPPCNCRQLHPHLMHSLTACHSFRTI